MRILHLLASPVFSGPAENVALLAAAQRALGMEVTIAVDRKRPGLTSEEPIVPRLREASLLDEEGLELSVKSSPMAMVRDIAQLRRRKVDVIHAHFSHDHLLAYLGRPRGAALLRSIHAPRSVRPMLPGADGFTIPFRGLGARLRARRVVVLPPLVDPAFGLPCDQKSLRNELGIVGEPVVGMASTFQVSRRHGLGIDAFARLRRLQPEAKLILLGDGVLEAELRSRVRRAGLEQAVTFAGYQQGARFARWLQALDELWVLGLGNDYSGRVAAQARACGLRVLAVDEGALPEVADTVLAELSADAIVQASEARYRRELPQLSNAAIARSMLQFYEEARGK